MARPRLTRRDLGPGYRTPHQRKRAARDVVILAAHHQGLSIRLIASGLGLDPKRVREIIGRATGG